MNINDVKRILEENDASVKKHFGQNFLYDDNVLNNIIKKSNINNTSNVVEIGPGLGFLTNYLDNNSKKVLCYEIDDEMIEVLSKKNFNHTRIIKGDFLTKNIDKDFFEYFGDEKIIIVANLPYYITTPILLKVLEETKRVEKVVVMMQKEVALRLCGVPKTKDYNSLSVLLQYYTNPKILFDVKPTSFYPEPGVTSSVIEISYKEKNEIVALNEKYFLKFNRCIFAQRRKTLMNNIQKSYPYNKEEILKVFEDLKLDASIRAEALSVSRIVELANKLYLKFEK